MANKTQIFLNCSEEFKEALGAYAQQHNVSVAIVVREAVARSIGYDLSSETIVDGRRKYANAEERREAQRQRQKKEREGVRLLLAAYAKEQRLFDAAIIESSLNKKGIDTDS